MKSLTKIFKLPGLGQAAIVLDPGQADNFPGGIEFHSNLSAQVIRNGKPVRASEVVDRKFLGKLFHKNDTVIDLGSGLVTNVGVLALANDFARSANLNLATLALANQHMSGTGTNAAAATDVKLQTISTNGGQTAIAGTQSLITAANVQKYQTVATVPYTGNEAVTEWGLHTSSVASSATGSPATAATGTSLSATGTPFTASSASVRGLQQFIVIDTATNVWGYITSNTTGVLTVPAWYKVSDGTVGATPGSTDAFVIVPVMWDRKTFAAVNVVSGDSIQFTYTLTVTSGG